MSLAALVPDVETIRTRWPTEPHRYSHGYDTFDDLLTIGEVNDLIDAECVAMRNLVLIKDGKVLERYLFEGRDHMPRPGAIRQHLDEGGTVSLRQLQTVKPRLARLQRGIQTVKPRLARLQRGIQADTGCLVHVNAYMTPPGAQGLKYHYDPYVTLIVQLAGRKTWPLHRPFVTNPMTEHLNFLERGFTDQERHFLANTPPVQAVTLEPGDVFWLPRGWVHSPYTEGDETSLHLTFALKERTYQWLAEQVTGSILAGAIRDPAMRAEIPPAALGEKEPVNFVREYLMGALMLSEEAELGALAHQSAHHQR